jgi:cell division septation protein DedD
MQTTAGSATGASAEMPVNSSASAAPPSGFYVQVAAVSRQEDAAALVEALKKKQYPAFSANNPTADKFYHVQVGPYAEMKDAEAMRARLVSDGYNPIVKR